jgi:kynureninase
MTASAPSVLGRDRAVELDRLDPLSSFRERFIPQTDDVVAYLDGNSLGRPLRSIATAWDDLVHRQWAGRLIRSWTEGWMELPEQVGDELGAAALGAAAGQTVIADSTTVNFYKAMRAALALAPGRHKIITDRDNFPTDRYVVESLAAEFGLEIIWLETDIASGVGLDDVTAVLDDEVAVVTLSHIAYRSGFIADVPGITAAAHRIGAVVVWDLCHSVGSTPAELDTWGVDFAVGCTYKFVGAGPGAPAFLYANARHHDRLAQPIWGWLGRADAFEMPQGYLPATGIRSMMSGTPSIPGILAVRQGARVIAEAGIDAIRQKAIALTSMTIDLYDEWFAPLGFALGSPRDALIRGGHVTVSRSDARQLAGRLVAAGVLVDFRTPDAVRIGLSPLPTSFAEVFDALALMREMAR